MNSDQLIQALIEELQHSQLARVDVTKEIALLLAWKKLSEAQDSEEFSLLENMAQGIITIRDAYQKLATALSKHSQQMDLGRLYSESQLPSVLSDRSAQEIAKHLSSTLKLNDFETVAALYKYSNVSKRGHLFDELSLPTELAKLMFNLGDITAEEMYAPFSSSLRIALLQARSGKHATIEATDNSPLLWAISLLSGVEIQVSDPIALPSVKTSDGGLKQFPVVQMVPPFGVRLENPPSDSDGRFSQQTVNGDVLAIEHGLSQCIGRMIALVPQGLLFRGANNFDLRASLVNKGWLEAVVQLPGHVLASRTNMPTAILVIDKDRSPNSPILFYNACQDDLIEDAGRGQPTKLVGWQQLVNDVLTRNQNIHSALIHPDEIRKHRYDLSVRRYVLGEASKRVRALPNVAPLSELVELIRAQALREEEVRIGDEFYEVGVRNIAENGQITAPEKRLLLSGRMRKQAKLQRLLPGDILISTKGTVGKVGLVGSECGDNWVANQIFQVIRLKDHSTIGSSIYLYSYLISPLVQAYLQEQATGSTIQMIKTTDLREMLVPVPSSQEEIQVLDTHDKIMGNYQKIKDIKVEINALNAQYWPAG